MSNRFEEDHLQEPRFRQTPLDRMRKGYLKYFNSELFWIRFLMKADKTTSFQYEAEIYKNIDNIGTISCRVERDENRISYTAETRSRFVPTNPNFVPSVRIYFLSKNMELTFDMASNSYPDIYEEILPHIRSGRSYLSYRRNPNFGDVYPRWYEIELDKQDRPIKHWQIDTHASSTLDNLFIQDASAGHLPGFALVSDTNIPVFDSQHFDRFAPYPVNYRTKSLA